MHLIQRDQIKCFLTTGQTRHCRSVPYLQGRSTLSASLLNSPQTGTFHYLSTFLHIHRIGLRCVERKREFTPNEVPGLRRDGGDRRGKEEA